MGRLDDIVRAVGKHAPPVRYQGLRDAAEAVYADGKGGWQMAEDLLYRYPDSMERVDQFVGDHKMELGRHLGAGAESLVWEVRPRSGDNANVLKVRVGDAQPSDFHFPDNVPGIAPYWAREQAGPNVAVALQPKADVVYAPKTGWEKPFQNASERLNESLLSRGWHWADRHQWNIGVMPDGTWGAVDGFVYRAPPDWTLPKIPQEEAIRMLRLTPDERMAIYGKADP